MTFGLELEPFPLAALALAALLAATPRLRAWLWRAQLDRFVLAASAAAALISAAYVMSYLRGGPRIVDATSYFLEARALSEGRLSWPDSDPSDVGRFLVRNASHDRVAVIFPPGYPAVLAVGFWIGAPMAIGPCLAFAVTWATGALARAALPAGIADGVARLAVLLSVVCGALRYHTADTMSHGLAAVCAAVGLTYAHRLRASNRARDALLAGAALGLLVAARPFSGAALAVVMGFVVGRRVRPSVWVIGVLASAPFLALLLAHQHAATGVFGQSSQAAYYASSDGPEGCFRYGFGARIGCLHEHGEFVRHNLTRGYDLVAALGTTLRRLKLHGVDALNAEPLSVAVLLPAFIAALARRGTRSVALFPVALVVVYAPFYFDGNYPGGGARFFADGLPVEHVVTAWFWVDRVEPWLERRLPSIRAPHWLVVASLVGFSLRAANEHRALRDREGGKPMFEPTLVAEAGIRNGLLFVDTDHGFSLAFDPAGGPLRVARYRGDHLDFLTWQSAGRPPSFLYDYEIASGRARVAPYVPAPMPAIDGASLWPPLAQRGAFALPAYGAWEFPEGESACGSGDRRLEMSHERGAAEIDLTLPAALAGSAVAPIVLRSPAGASITLQQGERVLGRWSFDEPVVGCHPSTPVALAPGLDTGAFMLRVRLPAASEGTAATNAAIDKLVLAGLAVAVDKSNPATGP